MSTRLTLTINIQHQDVADVCEDLEQALHAIEKGAMKGGLLGGDFAIIEEEVCDECGGVDGEHEDVQTMERVYPGEPHMAPIGTMACPNAD